MTKTSHANPYAESNIPRGDIQGAKTYFAMILQQAFWSF